MNYALAGQITVVGIIACYVASPLIGRWLRKRREQRDREARRVRLEKLVLLADEWDAAPTDKHRQAIYRKATDLGFTESNETEYRAFMDSDEGPRAA